MASCVPQTPPGGAQLWQHVGITVGPSPPPPPASDGIIPGCGLGVALLNAPQVAWALALLFQALSVITLPSSTQFLQNRHIIKKKKKEKKQGVNVKATPQEYCSHSEFLSAPDSKYLAMHHPGCLFLGQKFQGGSRELNNLLHEKVLGSLAKKICFHTHPTDFIIGEAGCPWSRGLCSSGSLFLLQGLQRKVKGNHVGENILISKLLLLP